MEKTNLYKIWDYLLASATTILFLLLYTKTLAPGLLTGDSAEFQVLSQQLGLTHAMGYPIYLLAGKLFSFLPINELPWRINLLSAVSASLSIGILYLIARLFTPHRLIALAAPVAFGLTGIFWKNSIIAEVYSTSSMVSNLILLLVLVWGRNRDWRLLVTAGFLGGLGLGIHSMVVLICPAILVYLFLCRAKNGEWSLATGGVIVGVLLLMFVFYWLALRDPVTGNIQSVILPNISRYGISASALGSPLKRMIFIMTAEQFRGTLFTLEFQQVLIYIKTYFTSLIQAVGLVWAILALFGLIAIFIPYKSQRYQWKEGVLISIGILTLIIIPANYTIRAGIVVFFIASYSLVALLAVIGLDFIQMLFISLIGWFKISASSVFEKVSLIVFRIVLVGIIAVSFIIKLDITHGQPKKPKGDSIDIKLADIQWVHYYTSKDLAEKMINQIDEDSIIFSDWRMLYPLQYVALIQKVKPHVTAIETNPYPGNPDLTQSELDLIGLNYPIRSIYFTREIPQLEKDYRFIKSDQEPFVYRLVKR